MKALGPNSASHLRGLPFVTAVVATGACVVYCHPAAQAALQYDRSAGGLSWLCRLLTCHATHWTADHLGWDVAAFLLLGALCERAGRRAFLACLLSSAVLVPLSLYVLQPRFTLYRGLSGIDSALFALLAVSLLFEPSANVGRRGRAVAAALLSAFLAKVVFEWATGRNVFVASSAFVPAPPAHLVGAAVGAGVACGRRLRPHRHQRKSNLECQTLSQRIQPCTT